MEKTPEELYREREKRINDVIQLKVPDRVPFVPAFQFFPAKYAGISFEEFMSDYDKLGMALKRLILDLQPDMYGNLYGTIALAPTLELLDHKQLRWPGHGLSSNVSYQYVEGEYMKAEEYDAFLDDPSDFMMRTFLPRVCGALEPLAQLAPLPWAHHWRPLVASIAILGNPEVAGALEALMKAGAEARKMLSKAREFAQEMRALGFPSDRGAAAYTPFDYIGDCLRGMRGVMLDMYRKPDKLLEAMDKILPLIVKMAADDARKSGTPRVGIPLHKGADGFMSLEQFKTFYWPTLRKMMLMLIDGGLTPCPNWEGNCVSRLEIIADIPKGKAIYGFEHTDIFKAKEILGSRVCIRGNVPGTLLCTGTPEAVREYCQKLIDVVGKGGGFIMDAGTGVPDEARIENVKAMAEVTREYGVY